MRHAAALGILAATGSRPIRTWIVCSTFALFSCLDLHSGFAEGCSVTIQVIGTDHEPVPKAEASLLWEVKDEVMTSTGDESAVADAGGKLVLRFNDRNEKRPALVFSPDRKFGGIVAVSKADDGKTLNVALGPTVRARGRLVCTELNSKPAWANTMVTPDGFRGLVAQQMGNSAQFDFLLPAGKYSFNSYGSDVSNNKQTITLAAQNPDVDLGAIDLKAAPIAKLKGKPAPTWNVTAARGVKRSAALADYKGRWVYLEFWGFW